MPKKPKPPKSGDKNQQNLLKGKKDVELKSVSDDGGCNDNTDIQEQFEVELCWCIQQLQKSLNLGKLNQKQVQEHTKTMNALMSNSTPYIKKRQLMRLTFGDYRAKMIDESNKASKGINLKISASSPCKKSKFVRKTLTSSNPNDSKLNFCMKNSPGNLANDVSEVDTDSKPFHFTTSSNNFRFNFDVNEN